MAEVIITLKIMPDSPEENLEAIKDSASKLIKEFGGEIHRIEENPVAFGLKAVNIIFIMQEAKGSTEELEQQVSELNGVSTVDVTDVRRAIG